MASTRRKSAAIALAVIGIAGLSLAAAAQLDVNSSTLGADSTIVAACDTDGISITYTVVGATVTEIKLAGVNADCSGDPYSIQLLQNDTVLTDPKIPLGSAVTELQTVFTVSGGNVTIPLGVGNAQQIAAVTGVSLIVH